MNNLPFATPTHPLMIGNYGFGDDPGACEFNGDIDDVRIYAKQLSGDDMVAITKCPCHTPTQSPCDSTSALVINTGWDQSTGSEIASGQADNEWVVMSDPDAGTTEPRPAFSIPPYNVNVSWAPAAANSRWVSSYPTSVDDLNGHYVYDYDFC